MTKIFADAEEKYLKTTVLYGKASDDYVYGDVGCTQKLSADEMLNALLKGAVVSYAGVYYLPISFEEDAGVVSVMIATTISASPVTVTLNSKEYAAE